MKANKCSQCPKSPTVQQKSEKILINEAVFYAKHHRSTSNNDILVSVLSNFYAVDELKIAKEGLWSVFDDLLPEPQARRDSQKRTESMAIAEDIMLALSTIEQNDIEWICYAEKWDRIPKASPECASFIALSDRFEQMEQKFRLYEEKMQLMSNELSDNKTRLQSCEQKSLAQEKLIQDLKVGRPETAVCDDHGGARPKTDDGNRGYASAAKMVPQKQTVHDGRCTNNFPDTRVANNPFKVQEVNNANSNGRASDVVPKDDRSNVAFRGDDRNNMTNRNNAAVRGAASHSENRENAQSGEWRTFHNRRDERRAQWHNNRKGRQTVVGQAPNTGLLAAPAPSRDFFISRVNKHVTVEQLGKYIKDNGVCYRDLTKTSHNDAVHNSFKLTVTFDDAAKVNDGAFWPKDVWVRKWRIHNSDSGDKNAGNMSSSVN